MQSKSEVRTVWEQNGLVPARRGRAGRLPVGGALARASGFGKACLELGRYYQAFAVFLAGRVDLLPGPYLQSLRGIPLPILGDAPALPGKFDISDIRELRTDLFSRAFGGTFHEKPVVVEVFCRSGIDEAEWDAFAQGVDCLRESPDSAVASEAVLDDFRKWLELYRDFERKRRMLNNLAASPAGCLTRPPTLVDRLQEDGVFGYERVDGVGPEGDPSELGFEAIIEQLLIHSFVPADDPRSEIRLLDGAQVGYRVWPFMQPVSVQHYYPMLQYVASALAEDSGRAMRMVAKLVRLEGGQVTEADLWRQVSGLRYEMGLDEVVPESVSKLTEYWRALGGLRARMPLFFHCFHRSLVLGGEAWVHSAVERLPVAATSVMARLVRIKGGEMMGAEGAREWGMGSNLIFLGAFRQLGTILEQIRENDLSVTVSTGNDRPATGRSAGVLLRGFVPAALFAMALQGALAAQGSMLGTILACCSLVAGSVFVIAVARR